MRATWFIARTPRTSCPRISMRTEVSNTHGIRYTGIHAADGIGRDASAGTFAASGCRRVTAAIIRPAARSTLSEPERADGGVVSVSAADRRAGETVIPDDPTGVVGARGKTPLDKTYPR